MSAKNVLIVGGYGRVGSRISELLAKNTRVSVTIAGRNTAKAEALARKLGTRWCVMDLTNRESIFPVIDDFHMVINCFAGPFTQFNLYLPEICAKRGIHYLDVSGSYEYAERFLKLNDLAIKNQAILMTALGANPGLPGILFMSFQETFDELLSCKIYFVLGSNLDGFSISSLKELKHMFDVKPLVWDKDKWIAPTKKNLKKYMGRPFEKDIYLGPWLTRDLFTLPKLVKVTNLSCWSGIQNSLQGLFMIAGLKLGLTRKDSSARFLLSLLKGMSTKSDISTALVRLEMRGTINGRTEESAVEVHGEESVLTAVVPAIVCKQISEEKITRCGTFLPPQIVPAADFVDRLKDYDVHYSTEHSGTKPSRAAL